jgi:phospholipid-binding lipoprotein MlaA
MRSSGWRASLFLAAPLALLFAEPSYAQERSDPWEGMNRRFFALQQRLDRAIIGPVARGLGKTPSPLRMGVRNVLRNLNEPTVAVNDVLQGRIGTAASTLGRFAINTIFGVGGIMDVAERGRIPHHDNDFGITLGRWGVGPGPYLFLPLVGPSTVRDAFGGAADIGLDPLTYVRYENRLAIGITTTIVQGLLDRIDAARDLATIEQTSIDPYATIRSGFLQDRQYKITGKSIELEPLPDFDTEGAPAPQPSPSVAQPPADATTPPPAPLTSEPTPPPPTAEEPKAGADGCTTGGMPP